MSAVGAGLVIASYRGGSTYAPLYETFVIVPLILAMMVGCVLIAIHLRRRDRRPKPVTDQWQALAVMGYLCPHGWQAHITLRGRDAPEPDDSPPSPVPLVELEWKQFDEQPGEVVVARRVWAPTIGEALQMMADDRRTDITLEQIEQTLGETEGASSEEL
jgi:hypothetical protein